MFSLAILLLILRFYVDPGLFGMAGRPRSRPLGVDSGPGQGGSEGVPGAPEPYTNIISSSRPDARHELVPNIGLVEQGYVAKRCIVAVMALAGPDYY